MQCGEGQGVVRQEFQLQHGAQDWMAWAMTSQLTDSDE